MKLVVDTNVIFSALLKSGSKELYILKKSNFQFFIPKVVFIELFKYKEKILRYSNLTEDEILELLYVILGSIKVVDEMQIPYEFRKLSYELTKDVDVKDAIFVALALALNAKIWTGDKKLREHLIKNNKEDLIISTKELLHFLKI
jgi:putative PIN family toxin of toxin-antitoxin system